MLLPRIDVGSLVAVPCPVMGTASGAMGFGDAEVKAAMCTVVEQALEGRAHLLTVARTEIGNAGLITIPIVDLALFDNPEATVRATMCGVDLAIAHGASCISFTGMIPAATRYGRAISEAVRARAMSHPGYAGVVLTTGHAAVVAAFIMNVDRILSVARRDLAEESVAFVGLGSIGRGALELLLRLGRRPREITLVDLPSKEVVLGELKALVETEIGCPGRVALARPEGEGGVPQSVYDSSSLILSATSSPRVVDIERVAKGTLIVDDSFPLGFDTAKAKRRVRERKDILLTTAGTLEAPWSIHFDPARPVGNARFDGLLGRVDGLAGPAPRALTACVFSALLTPRYKLPPTQGPVDARDAHAFHAELTRYGFSGPALHVLDLSDEGPFQVEAEWSASSLAQVGLARPPC